MDKEDERDLHQARNLHQHIERIDRLKHLDHIVHHADKDPMKNEVVLYFRG